MKIKRQKHAKKNIAFYKYNFSFREPYQILVDGTFCQAALKNKIQIKEQLPKYFMGEVQLCTTNCILRELESLGKQLYGAKVIAKRFQVRNCEHLKGPIHASKCLSSMVEGNNPHHYFIATQDQDLMTKIKKMIGVPLIFIIQNTMVLDKPSPKSLSYIQEIHSGQLVPVHQQTSIQQLKEELGLTKDSQERRRKRKRLSGPNPLSCLKKKKKTQTPTQLTQKTKKRIRHRKRRQGHAVQGISPVQITPS